MIPIKSEEEIAIMKKGGAILARIMKSLLPMVKPGVSTNQLDRAASALIFNYKEEPAFLGYDGFPAVLCVCLNNVIVHAVPSDCQFKEGDIVSLDMGIKHKGFYLDMAITLPVGKVGFDALMLIKVTKKALKIGLQKAMPGNTFGDISGAIQKYVEAQGFNVVRDLCGHGIGKQLHEEPKILNFGKPGTGEQIKPGMVFCLEPMLTAGDWRLKKSSDGFGYETQDSSLTSHFEHTVAITKKGPLVLTKI